MKVGMIGLGSMGQPMARNLLKAGHELIVYNRTRRRAEKLQSEGARIANTAAEAAAAEVLITMLADDAALAEVLFDPGKVLGALARRAVHISMSTISVALSKRLAAAHREAGQVYVSAPVFGRPEAAEAAQLFIVAAGPSETLRRCQPLFDALGQKTFVVGEEGPEANVVKLCGNFLIASVIESLGEAVALVRKLGISPPQFLEVLTGSLFAAPVYKTYGARIALENYEPAGFKLTLGLKDIRLALAAAEEVSVPMPTASLIRDQMLSATARGLGDSDWASLARVAAQNAGLKALP